MENYIWWFNGFAIGWKVGKLLCKNCWDYNKVPVVAKEV